MGVDWFRFKLKDNTDISLVKQLIDRQAVSYQSLWGWNSNFNRDENSYSLLQKIHLESYLEASKELKKILYFPLWNDEKGYAEDIPELNLCMRVYPITRMAIFPPLWRVMDCRTYLPAELERQLDKWQTWVTEVKENRHDEYLRELHLYKTLDIFTYHLDMLQNRAIASFNKESSWAEKPELQKIRQKILEHSQVQCIEIRIDPQQPISDRIDNFDSTYREIFNYLRDVISLTKAWDSRVRGNWKVKYYEDNYYLSFEDFKCSFFDDDWLEMFFNWANQCKSCNFGLYLDY